MTFTTQRQFMMLMLLIMMVMVLLVLLMMLLPLIGPNYIVPCASTDVVLVGVAQRRVAQAEGVPLIIIIMMLTMIMIVMFTMIMTMFIPVIMVMVIW